MSNARGSGTDGDPSFHNSLSTVDYGYGDQDEEAEMIPPNTMRSVSAGTRSTASPSRSGRPSTASSTLAGTSASGQRRQALTMSDLAEMHGIQQQGGSSHSLGMSQNSVEEQSNRNPRTSTFGRHQYKRSKDEMDLSIRRRMLMSVSVVKVAFLKKEELWSLFYVALAWACIVCNITLVGAYAVIIYDISDQQEQRVSIPLATWILGASAISVIASTWIFSHYGRKKSFLIGNGIAYIGSLLGGLAMKFESESLLFACSACFGMATGIGFFLRFAVTSLVPVTYSTRAITWVIGAGCIAAFAGPETAAWSADWFEVQYLGIFVAMALFNTLQAFLVYQVDFPDEDLQLSARSLSSLDNYFHTIMPLFRDRAFVIPTMLSAMAWTAMAMPMAMVRVVMDDLGHTHRESLLTIELHFLAKYSPGFVISILLKNYGPSAIGYAAQLFFIAGIVMFYIGQPDYTGGAPLPWILGMMFNGIGWSFGFTTGSVWVNQLAGEVPRTIVHAMHDTIMFGISGIWVMVTAFIFERGGGGLSGWRTFNGFDLGLVLFMTGIVVYGVLADRRELARRRERLPNLQLSFQEGQHDQSVSELDLSASHSSGAHSRPAHDFADS